MALKTALKENKSKRKYDSKITGHAFSFKTKSNKLKKKQNTKTTQIKKSSPTESKHIVNRLKEAGIMSSFYPQYQQYNYPIAVNEWSPIIPVNPLYTLPMPVVVNPPGMMSTQICPYVPSMIPPIIPSIAVTYDISPETSYYESHNEESLAGSFYESDCGVNKSVTEEPIDYYLSLPKDLFPSPRTAIMNPNIMINEFCKLSNVYKYVPWILDLEFGIPKSPITRPIPCYNVKFNSIHCKNTPDAIHPGFESCSEDFKRVLLFHYDSIISAWYRGYVYSKCDRSVDNFQSWLLPPTQALGMCWP